jgi:hypothetical protein
VHLPLRRLFAMHKYRAVHNSVGRARVPSSKSINPSLRYILGLVDAVESRRMNVWHSFRTPTLNADT